MIIKDALYGMIDISEDYFCNIICHEGFQRLKDIVQISYKQLLPDAIHLNRFEHSIGVYHLGKMLLEHLQKQTIKIDTVQKETFYLACLLHDYGHTPYSHIGEICFAEYVQVKKEDCSPSIQKLKNIISDSNFDYDIDLTLRTQNSSIATHEIFSVIFSIETFLTFFEKKGINKELFARMILGCHYHNSTYNSKINNIFISFLHGTGIEVDFIECAYRGSFYTNYKHIEYQDIYNLINSILILEQFEENCIVVSEKGAKVFYDLCQSYQYEKNFFQNNPLVLREVAIIKKEMYDLYMEESQLFNPQILTDKGCIVEEKKISYATDDIFNNIIRRHRYGNEKCFKYRIFDKTLPLWKDYHEYSEINGNHDYTLSECLNSLFDYARKIFHIYFLEINDKIFYFLKEHEELKKHENILRLLKRFCEMHNKHFLLYYIPSAVYNIVNARMNETWQIRNDKGVVVTKKNFYCSTYDDMNSKSGDFYYIYMESENGLTKDEWRIFLNTSKF